MKIFLGGMIPRKCPVCGREFITYQGCEWGYTYGGINGKKLCSWKCLRRYEANKIDEGGTRYAREKTAY